MLDFVVWRWKRLDKIHVTVQNSHMHGESWDQPTVLTLSLVSRNKISMFLSLMDYHKLE